MSTRTVVLGALLATLLGCAGPEPPPAVEPLPLTELLGAGATAGFERAVSHRNFRFPEDHGPHEGFRTEWWYYTGNLTGDDGRRFGYQLTFFRSALAPAAPNRTSAWGASHAWMAHFAVTDVAGDEFHPYERFAREALGLAGARGEPFRVWLEDWSADVTTTGFRLRASQEGTEIDLSLEPGKPPVLQGEAGLSRKGAAPGNASYYYSQTRMPTTGQLRLNGRTTEVSGESWMDREWSTSVLEQGQIGWDWISIQLEDGRELMIYQIRRADGSSDPHSDGTLVEQDGSYSRLPMSAWRLEVTESWTSPESGTTYPSGWRLAVPVAGLELDIEPLIANQEIPHSIRYWEGAVEVSGRDGERPIRGQGYAELTGYR